MKEYRAVFKCRLCGTCFDGVATGSRIVAEKAVVEAVTGTIHEPLSPTMNDAHQCKNGNIGITDFLGFREMEVKSEPID